MRAINRPGSPNTEIRNWMIAKNVKLAISADKANNPTLCTSTFSANNATSTTISDWINPTTAKTDTLLANQDAPFDGFIAVCTKGNTIEIH